MGWFRTARAARRQWEEFQPVARELVTADDAARMGLPVSWFRHFVEDNFRGEDVRAEQFRFALEDPSIRDLLRYKVEQRELHSLFALLLDEPIHPHDAVAAGVCDLSLVAVHRELFPGRDEVPLGELLPESTRRAVRALLFGRDGRPNRQRVRHVLARRDQRLADSAEFADRLDRAIEIQTAIEVGAADATLRDLARIYFGETLALRVEQLLLAPQVPAFVRVLGWQRMMSCLDVPPASRA